MTEEVIEVVIDSTGAVAGLDDVRKDLDKLKSKAQVSGKESGSALANGFKEHGAGVKGLLNDLTGGMANMFEDTLDSVRFLGVGIKGLKTAIVASGIGALLVAAGMLVAYWDDIKEAMTGVSSSMKEQVAMAEQRVAAAEKELQSISDSENILKLQGKSEMDILKIKQEKTKEEIKALEAQLEAQKTMKVAQVETATRNRDILKGLVNFISLPLTVLLAGFDELTAKARAMGIISEETYQSIGNLRDRFTTSVAELIFDPAAVATEADAAIAETEKKLLQMKNQEAGFQIQINQIRKDAAAKRAEEQAKADAEELERRKKLMGEFEALEAKGTEVKRTAAEDQFQIELEKQKKETEIRAEYLEKQAQLEQQDRERKKALRAAEVQMASDAIGALIALNEAFGTRDGKQTKAAFERNKKLQIAQALVQTYQAATAAFASASASPITAVFPAYPFIQAAAAAAFGIANVKKIASTQFEGGGTGTPVSASGGGNVPSGGGSPTPNVSIPQLNQGNQPPMRAYVQQGEITRANETQERIRKQTEIGG